MQHGSRMTAGERQDYALGRQGFERGDAAAAVPPLARLVQTRSFADVHYMLGVMYEQQSDLDAASQSLREALRINPSYTEAMLALANVYEEQGDFDRSREIAERSRALARPGTGVIDATTRGKLANLQAELGDAFREAGELHEAIDAYRKALDRCPNFPDIRHRFALALGDAGLPDRAIAEFRRVLDRYPGYHESAVALGVTYYSLGRIDDAIREWKGVLDADPRCEQAHMYLRLVGRGDDSP